MAAFVGRSITEEATKECIVSGITEPSVKACGSLGDRAQGIGFAAGALIFALTQLAHLLLKQGWSLWTGLAAIFLALALVQLIHSLTHSWKSAIGRAVAIVAFIGTSMWWLSRHDGFFGFSVLLVAALLFGYALPSIAARHARSNGTNIEAAKTTDGPQR